MKENNYLQQNSIACWRFFRGGMGMSFVSIWLMALALVMSQQTNAQCDTPVNTFPFEEGFENGALPDCWESIPVYEGWFEGLFFDWNVVSENVSGEVLPRTGSGMAQATQEDYYAVSVLSTPSLDLTGLTVPYLTFYFANQDYDAEFDYLQVVYKTSADDEWIELGDLINESYSTWQEFSIALPDASADYYIGFRADLGYGYGLNIDDVYVGEAPSCLAPSALLGVSTSPSTADISWTASLSNPSDGYSWEVLDAEDNVVDFGVSTGISASVDGLLANTAYTVRVKSICGDNIESLWATSAVFITHCEAFDIPWVDGFESLTANGPAIFPECWTKESGDWRSSVTSTSSYDSNPRNGTYFITNQYGGNNEYIWTPGFNLTAGVSYDFSFWYASYNTSLGFTAEVYWNTAPSSTDATQLGDAILTATTVPPVSYTELLRAFVPEEDGVYYFGIQVSANSTPWYLSFDDFSLKASPACMPPTALVVTNSNSSNSVEFSWTASTSNPADGYAWEVVDGDDNVVASGTTEETSDTASGLSSGTAYTISLTALCTAGESEGISTEFSTCPDNAVCAEYLTAGNTHFIATPALNSAHDCPLTATVTIPDGQVISSVSTTYSITAANNAWTSEQRSALFNTTLNVSEPALIAGIGDAAGTQGYSRNNLTFANGGSGVQQFALKAWRTWQGAGTCNDTYNKVNPGWKLIVYYTDAPECSPASVLTASAITGTGATFNWTASISETVEGYAWEVLDGNDNVIDSGISTGTTASTNLLSPTTQYTFTVTTICDGDITAETVESAIFTTTCGALDIPYYQNFDSVTAPALPACVTAQNVNNDAYTWITNTTYAASAPNCVYIRWNASQAMNDWFYLQGLNLEEGVSYRLQYSYRTGGGYEEDFEVFYGNSATSAAMTTELYNHEGVVNTAYITHNVDFIPEASGIYFIGFHGYSATNMFFLTLDNISVTLSPECAEPVDLTVSNLTDSEVSFSWAAPSTVPANGYAWEIQDEEGATIASGTTDELAVTSSALTAQSEYTLLVTSLCSDEDESAPASVDFTTPCTAIDQFPFTETFDTESETFDCWTINNVVDALWYPEYGSAYGDIPAPHSGDLNMALDGFFDYANFVSPVFDLSSLSATGAEVNFWYANPIGGWLDDYDELEVYYRTTPTGPWTLIPGGTFYNPVSNWTEVTLTLPEISSTYYIGFEGLAYSGTFVIDDVTVRAIAPACDAPADVTVSDITDSGTVVSWTESVPAPENGYDWQVLDTDDNVVASGTSSSNSATVVDLNSMTEYTVQVRAVCDEELSSDWSEGEVFTTLPTVGCMDETACNYNPDANIEDNDSCTYSTTVYADEDGDGYGNPEISMEGCPVDGYVTNNTDCDDADENVWQSQELYIDADGDGYDNGMSTICYGATIPTGYAASTEGTDCDDEDASVWRSSELYIDADGDGYHGVAETICYGEEIPSGYVTSSEGADCNDEDETVWQSLSAFIDADGDGYDAGTETICFGEELPEGYSNESLGADCNDDDDSIWTAVPVPVTLDLPVEEVCDNGGVITLTGGLPTGGTWSGEAITAGIFNPSGLEEDDYTITYTVQGDGACVAGNSAQAIIEVDDCSSVEESAKNQIKLFPTVTNNQVTVMGVGLTDAVIMDTNGKRLNTVSLFNTSIIEMQSYATGIYFIHVTSATSSEMFKVIKVN